MKRLLGFVLALLGIAAVPALAADAYTTTRMTLRTGPDSGYPRIRTLAPGTPLAVQGCIGDFLWCDVIAYGDRGWVAGDYLDFRFSSDDWRKGRPQLAAWHKRFAARPSMKETYPKDPT